MHQLYVRENCRASWRTVHLSPVVRDVEPFKPKVKRDHLDFGAPVGKGETAKNDSIDLIGAKKALSNTKLFEFDVTKEPSNVAGKRFIDSVKAFQGNRGLKIDDLMNPEGPTVKALRSLLFPQGTASNTGRPVDLSPAIAVKPPDGAEPPGKLLPAIARADQPKADTPRAALGDAPPDKPAKPAAGEKFKTGDFVMGGEGLLFRQGETDGGGQPEARDGAATAAGKEAKKEPDIKWKQEESFPPGSSRPRQFKTKGPVKVTQRTATLGIAGLRYRVDWHPLDENGKVIPEFRAPNSGPKEFGGHVLPFTRNETVIEPPYPNQHGFQVTITVPLQPSVHGNSTGVFLDIFRSD